MEKKIPKDVVRLNVCDFLDPLDVVFLSRTCRSYAPFINRFESQFPTIYSAQFYRLSTCSVCYGSTHTKHGIFDVESGVWGHPDCINRLLKSLFYYNLSTQTIGVATNVEQGRSIMLHGVFFNDPLVANHHTCVAVDFFRRVYGYEPSEELKVLIKQRAIELRQTHESVLLLLYRQHVWLDFYQIMDRRWGFISGLSDEWYSLFRIYEHVRAKSSMETFRSDMQRFLTQLRVLVPKFKKQVYDRRNSMFVENMQFFHVDVVFALDLCPVLKTFLAGGSIEIYLEDYVFRLNRERGFEKLHKLEAQCSNHVEFNLGSIPNEVFYQNDITFKQMIVNARTIANANKKRKFASLDQSIFDPPIIDYPFTMNNNISI